MGLEQLCGVGLPLVQAPMAGAQGSALAISVCSAGALGSLPCAMLDAATMSRELSAIRDDIAGRPFNVNFFCHTPPDQDPERDRRWRDVLTPYYDEFGIDARVASPGPGRLPFSHDIADALEPFTPPVVSFHFGLPSSALLSRVRGWGGKIISSATTVDEARWLEARGVDAIIAQGLEAGGHRGHFLSDALHLQLGTFALVPQIVRAVAVPVIAAGGIADAHGVAAALALGAAGVQVGTAYLLCPEATTSAVHRASLETAAARVTTLTNVFTGRPARAIVNRLVRELGPLSELSPAFPLAVAAIAPLRRVAEERGRDDFSPLWAGQNVSGCRQVPAAVLTRELTQLVT